MRRGRRGGACRTGPATRKTPPRIIASAGTELMALDARTGKPVAAFGDEGVVELEDSMNSPAAIYKDLAITPGQQALDPRVEHPQRQARMDLQPDPAAR